MLRTIQAWRRVALVFGLVVALTALAVQSAAARPASSHARPLKVALLVPALANDGSFNSWALTAVKKLQAQGLITYQLRENMADPSKAEPVIREFASQGYDLIIGHGIELGDPIFKVAKEFPNVHFTASGGADIIAKHTPNVETWTYDFGQFGYLGGFVAGKVAKVDKIGIVEGPKYPFVVAGDNGFKAGLKATNPSAKVIGPVFTGSYTDLQKASEATGGLIDQGAQLVFTGSDFGNAVASAAASRKVLTVGTVGEAAKKVNIATVSLDMYPIFKLWVDRVRAGTFGNKGTVSTIANRGLVVTAVNRVDGRVPAGLSTQVKALAAALASGKKKLPSFGG